MHVAPPSHPAGTERQVLGPDPQTQRGTAASRGRAVASLPPSPPLPPGCSPGPAPSRARPSPASSPRCSLRLLSFVPEGPAPAQPRWRGRAEGGGGAGEAPLVSRAPSAAAFAVDARRCPSLPLGPRERLTLGRPRRRPGLVSGYVLTGRGSEAAAPRFGERWRSPFRGQEAPRPSPSWCRGRRSCPGWISTCPRALAGPGGGRREKKQAAVALGEGDGWGCL